ncbi:uncharacterized protein LOC134192312 [Corticium candelabrum]|uniref:uncharacterized protein LOC134192312 n=1 Tax=Corticium candelabrum TaxID=121492 RepID=UPI002E270C43|nr:uncharacterized protein LOC134192312 [Corticium candelabrum]
MLWKYVYNALPFETPADAQDIQKVLDLMEENFIGEKNTIYKRYNFQKRQQEDNETIDQYVTALRTLARTCSFGTDADERLRDQIVYGVKLNVLRKKLLQKIGLTLAECLDMCRAYEATTQQMKVVTGEELVHSVSIRRTKPDYSRKLSDKERKNTKRSHGSESEHPELECQYRGLKHERGADKCPAYGKECTYCHKRNHFARKCRSKRQRDTRQRIHVATNRDESAEDDKYWFLR